MAQRAPRGASEGYALLTVVFLAAAMIIAATAAAPNLLTQGQREKEEELIWRGEQHARAVRLFYRKFGRFPLSLEELAEPKQQIRFLRKPYKDPMNRQDGSWRLIYVSPTGQLIGSVMRTSAIQLPAAQPAQRLGAQASAGQPGPSAQPAQPAERQQRTQPRDEEEETEQQPGARRDTPAPPQPPAPTTSRPEEDKKVFGANIIGVASKVPKPSLKVYKRGRFYREWEFIWDPVAEAAAAVQPGGTRPGTLADTPPQAPGIPLRRPD